MRKKGTILLGILAITFAGCGSAQKSQRPAHEEFAKIKSLAIVVKQERDFEVIYNRATANATSAALFGLAGAAITASIDEGKDKERAEQMAQAVSEICCHSDFAAGLAALEQNARFEKIFVVDDPKEPLALGEYDAVVTFTIKQWGLRLVEQRQDAMAGFMEIDMKVQDAAKKAIWDERHVVIGQGREYLRKYMTDASLVQNELKQTIQDAGMRMSNLLIYQ